MSQAAAAGGSTTSVLRASAAAVIVIAGLKLGAPVLVPIAFALFLAVLSFPLFHWMLDHKVPKPIAVLATVLLLVAVLGAFVVLGLGSLAELRETGPAYWASLQDRLSYTVEWWQERGIAIQSWVPPGWRDPNVIVRWVGGALRGAFGLLSGLTIIVLVLIFLLSEAAALPGKLERLPERVRVHFEHFGSVSRDLQRYLLIKTLMSATVGLACGTWVALLGVDFAVLWGLVAFACHFIPNIGAVLAAGPAMLVALVQFDASKAIVLVLGYLAIGLLLGNLLEPSLLGRRLGLSTLVVFLSLVFWGWLWGAMGMFLSVPLTMALRILVAHSSEHSWIATLLDAAPRAQRPPAASAAGPEARPASAESH